MYKILGLIAIMIFGGCSGVKVTAAMCDKLQQDAGEIPKECQNYSKKKAAKAFNKVSEDKKVSSKELEFSKDK
jgi:hypothetical protein